MRSLSLYCFLFLLVFTSCRKQTYTCVCEDSAGGKHVKTGNYSGNDPDEYRVGIGYIGIGPFRFGNDRESRRHRVQNQLVHDKIGSPRFTIINRPNRFYFQFGSGGGYLW
jgi:hypothetical protein